MERIKKKTFDNSADEKGFTLIELIIYLTILSIVMSSFLYFSLAILNYRNKSRAIEEVQANERMAINLISQKIRSAKSVNFSQSVFNSHPGSLSLAMDDIGRSPTLINLDNGKLQISEGLSQPVSITSDRIIVSDLVFFDLTGSSSIANIGFILKTNYADNQDPNFLYSNILRSAVSLRR